jgi:hypothetical protein
MNIESINFQKRCGAVFPCGHCQGLTDHEPWCIMRDPKVQYAYAIVNDPCALTYRDSLILHSLGVAWRDRIREAPPSDQEA